MRRRFFVERFANGTAALAGEAAYHLGRVLRAEPGQEFELSDGQSVQLARVTRVGRDVVEFALVAPVPVRTPSLKAGLLLAIVKFDRFEWALEKATELGVAAIVPLAAERCEKGLVAAAEKKAARWRKILAESAQQARCLRPPVLETAARPREAFAAAKGTVSILLSERPSASRLRGILSSATPQTAGTKAEPAVVTLAVGPEGGWTDSEFATAEASGFQEGSIGDLVLRTETAVVAGLAALHLYLDAAFE